MTKYICMGCKNTFHASGKSSVSCCPYFTGGHIEEVNKLDK